MRLYDEKRRLIKVGDIIEFTNRATDEKLSAKVLQLHLFKNFNEFQESFTYKNG